MKKIIIGVILALPSSAIAFCPIPAFTSNSQYNSMLRQQYQECLNNERYQQQQLMMQQQQLQIQQEQLQLQREQLQQQKRQQQQIKRPSFDWN